MRKIKGISGSEAMLHVIIEFIDAYKAFSAVKDL